MCLLPIIATMDSVMGPQKWSAISKHLEGTVLEQARLTLLLDIPASGCNAKVSSVANVCTWAFECT